MATRARIGVVTQSGRIVSNFVRWDAYPAYIGPTLLNHWSTEEKIRELDLCWTTEDGLDDEGHIQSASDLKEFRELCKSNYCDYMYLFVNGSWHVGYPFNSDSIDRLDSKVSV